MSGEYSRDDANGDSHRNGSVSSPSSPYANNTNANRGSSGAAIQTGPPKAVEDVLESDIGISTLLNRLKQSIASARDFAVFLKKRSSLEEEQATGLKRLARAQLESVRKGEVRGGSYAAQLADVLKVHERMGDNGMQFALSLHQMHEDLQELSNTMERGRKQWKHDGLDVEKKASDAEQMMQKAKARYDSLAEDYDRARTGDTKGSRRIGLKGPKSAEQYESDLLRKTQTADADYEEKVRAAKTQREQLLKKGRPEAIHALEELIKECDSALTLQLQKFATFNEKLLLGNGLAVSPLTDKDGPSAQRSLRDIIVNIDNEKDFHSYVSSHVTKIVRPSEIRYEQHPTMAPKTQQPRQAPSTVTAPPTVSQPSLSVNNSTSQPGSTSSRYAAQPQSQPPPEKSYSQTPTSYPPQLPQLPSHQDATPSYRQASQPTPPYSQQQPPPMRGDAYSSSGPPYPVHSTERQPTNPAFSNNTHQQTTGSIPAPVSTHAPIVTRTPTRPVFGLSLQELFDRDQSAVPMVVFQCMQAIDTFGVDVEGVYRVNGATSHVQALKQAFDTLPPSAPQLDFRNPANFYHDVNAVTTLLKLFFRDLPDPLFTNVGYRQFIAAARLESVEARRDALHQGINDLPDPNYATLRAVVLHLHRMIQFESRTRMNAGNLAVCFAPSLLGAQHAVADTGLQAKVVDTILGNATAIFDDD